MPGDTLVDKLLDNDRQRQANYSWYSWCYCFALFLINVLFMTLDKTNDQNILS